MLKFNRNYFLLAAILFVVEVLIALFLHDKFVRPYVGDYLVVIMVYCFLKAFINLPVMAAAVTTLLFAYTVEFAQYYNTVDKLGLQNSEMATTVMGTSFSWPDMIAYTLGVMTVILIEKTYLAKQK